MKTTVFSALDFKVGLRMLARYPGLTVVSTLAIAVAIALGTLYFEAVNKWQNPQLPVRDADRVVSISGWDVNAFRPEGRLLHEFATWREQVKTIENLGAAISFVRNLATEDGRVEPVQGAEITANAFRLMGVAPILGRALADRDENAAEPAVVVISHRLWTTRFESDAAVVGKTIKLGTVSATIVGVMPEGFGFPVNQRIWTPLRANGAAMSPRTGPNVSIFGRLADGASIEDARAELAAIGARFSTSYPETHKHLRPRVMPYGKPNAEGGVMQTFRNVAYGLNLIFLGLLTIV